MKAPGSSLSRTLRPLCSDVPYVNFGRPRQQRSVEIYLLVDSLSQTLGQQSSDSFRQSAKRSLPAPELSGAEKQSDAL